MDRSVQMLENAGVFYNPPPVTPGAFFSDKTLAKELFDAICREVEAVGEVSIRVKKSQISFRRRRGFA